MIVVDAHSHLGFDYVFEEDFTTEKMLKKMERGDIAVSIVQPGTVFDLEGVIKQHNDIADLSTRMRGRIFGMANPNPHLSFEDYHGELERCVNTLGFVGVKLHPLAHAVNPSSLDGRKVFQTALDLGIPVMVHTGVGGPWALPSALIPIATEFPQLKIILAHSGSAMFSNEAAIAARLCPNIYLETSWLPSITIHSLCKTLGADRLMFGSDHAENAETELAKYRTMGLSEEDLEWCLGNTALKVFGIQV
ncbi:MAG: amidohydrolase family protein [Thermoproteota archaeon]